MIFYCLDQPVPEGEGEGMDMTEWFTSKSEAKRRYHKLRKDLLDVHDRASASMVTLDEVEVVDLPRKKLVLAILNRRAYVKRTTQLLPKPDDSKPTATL